MAGTIIQRSIVIVDTAPLLRRLGCVSKPQLNDCSRSSSSSSSSSNTSNFSVIRDKRTTQTNSVIRGGQSTQHWDLASFANYARRTGLNKKSTVYVGTHYEYTVAAALTELGFSLQRIGGSSDLGTDLVGTWSLAPALPRPLRTLAQCKAGAQRIGPHHVRELEGAFVGAPVGWRGRGVLGLLVCERTATKGVRDSLTRSSWPLAFICCSASGLVSQMLWNGCAEEEGLEGVGVVVKHVKGGQEQQIVLTYNGLLVRRHGEMHSSTTGLDKPTV